MGRIWHEITEWDLSDRVYMDLTDLRSVLATLTAEDSHRDRRILKAAKSWDRIAHCLDN